LLVGGETACIPFLLLAGEEPVAQRAGTKELSGAGAGGATSGSERLIIKIHILRWTMTRPLKAESPPAPTSRDTLKRNLLEYGKPTNCANGW
jgi:hypothetical protein